MNGAINYKCFVTNSQLQDLDDMSTNRLLFQAARTIKIQLSGLGWYKADIIIIELRNKSWKPECVGICNMDWQILVFYPEPEARDKIY